MERDKALDMLRGLYAESAQGRGRVAVVGGAVGSGRTTMLDACADHAIEAGAIFLTATGSLAERMLPLGVINQLLQDAPFRSEIAARISGLVTESAGAIWAGGAEADAIPHLAADVMHEICMALLDLAGERPLLIGVDDVDHADVPSRQCLLYLVRRLRSARVMVILNECTSQRPSHRRLSAEVLRHPHARLIRLPLLTTAGVAGMIPGDLPAPVAHRLATEWYAISGGNPLLASALVDDHQAAGQPPGPVVGDAFVQAVMRCLDGYEPSMVDVINALAVLGDGGSLEVAGRLAGLEPETAAQVMAAIDMTGLLGDGGLRHPALRSAVLDGMTPEIRAQASRRAAGLLQSEGAAPNLVAKQLLSAGQAQDTWAVPVLEEVAARALAEGTTAEAVEYLRTAYDACTDSSQRITIGALLAAAEWRVNPAAALRHLPDLSAGLRDGLLQGRHATVPIRQLLWHGQVAEAVQALEHLAGHPETLDAEVADELRHACEWAAHVYPAFGARAAAVVKRLPARDSSPVTGHPAEDAERFLQQTRLEDSTLGPVTAALATLIYEGRLKEAASWCAVLLGQAQARGAGTWRAIILAVQAEIALREGDLAAAEAGAAGALDLLSPQGWGVAIGGPMSTLILALTAMGRSDEAAEHLDRAIPPVAVHTRPGLHYLYARGSLNLARKRPHAALSDFLTCGTMMGNWAVDLPSLVPWRTAAAAACLQLDQRSQAEAYATDQLARLGDGDARTRGISLRQLAASSDLTHRPRLLRGAVEALQKSGDRLHLGYALADLGQVHRALGESKRAGMLVVRAHRLAEQCRAIPLQRRLGADLHRAKLDIRLEAPAHINSTATLSDAERRVATLASLGYTNREIAAELYITVSTVEQHLTRVYRKLNVRRRVDLPDDLHQRMVS